MSRPSPVVSPSTFPAAESLLRVVRTFGLAAAIINITVGGGILRLPATVAGALGSAAPVAYLVCALAMALIVLCIADAGSRVSLSGGPYALAADRLAVLCSVGRARSSPVPKDTAGAPTIPHAGSMTKTTQLARMLAVTGLLLSFTAVAGAADTPDAWVTMKTKVSLMTTDGLSTSDLNVDTVKGIVTLHGKVATDAEKTMAETVARGIDGAKDVKNLLQVVPASRRAIVERADDVVKKSVENAFAANRRLKKSGISVASVNKGVVLLNGTTPSWAAHLEAVEVARAVSGVRRVSTEVTVKPTT